MGELIFVGLGLAGAKDLTLRALEAVQGCRVVFAEFYTSHLIGATQSQLERTLGKPVTVLARDDVEQGPQRILEEAARHRVAFLTAGDPMTATTHLDLRLRAQERKIPTRVIHGVSIQVAAASACGLQSYKFGRTTTIPFPTPKLLPESVYRAVQENRARGLHTLVLLDLDAAKDRFLRAQEGVQVLLQLEDQWREHVVTPKTELVALARVGSDDERIVAGPAQQLAALDLGAPLHCLIVPGALHFAEDQALAHWRSAR